MFLVNKDILTFFLKKFTMTALHRVDEYIYCLIISFYRNILFINFYFKYSNVSQTGLAGTEKLCIKSKT